MLFQGKISKEDSNEGDNISARQPATNSKLQRLRTTVRWWGVEMVRNYTTSREYLHMHVVISNIEMKRLWRSPNIDLNYTHQIGSAGESKDPHCPVTVINARDSIEWNAGSQTDSQVQGDRRYMKPLLVGNRKLLQRIVCWVLHLLRSAVQKTYWVIINSREKRRPDLQRTFFLALPAHPSDISPPLEWQRHRDGDSFFMSLCWDWGRSVTTLERDSSAETRNYNMKMAFGQTLCSELAKIVFEVRLYPGRFAALAQTVALKWHNGVCPAWCAAMEALSFPSRPPNERCAVVRGTRGERIRFMGCNQMFDVLSQKNIIQTSNFFDSVIFVGTMNKGGLRYPKTSKQGSLLEVVSLWTRTLFSKILFR